MLFTSRTLVQDDGAGGLEVGALVTRAICALVRDLRAPPAFLVAKVRVRVRVRVGLGLGLGVGVGL